MGTRALKRAARSDLVDLEPKAKKGKRRRTAREEAAPDELVDVARVPAEADDPNEVPDLATLQAYQEGVAPAGAPIGQAAFEALGGALAADDASTAAERAAGEAASTDAELTRALERLTALEGTGGGTTELSGDVVRDPQSLRSAGERVSLLLLLLQNWKRAQELANERGGPRCVCDEGRARRKRALTALVADAAFYYEFNSELATYVFETWAPSEAVAILAAQGEAPLLRAGDAEPEPSAPRRVFVRFNNVRLSSREALKNVLQEQGISLRDLPGTDYEAPGMVDHKALVAAAKAGALGKAARVLGKRGQLLREKPIEAIRAALETEVKLRWRKPEGPAEAAWHHRPGKTQDWARGAAAEVHAAKSGVGATVEYMAGQYMLQGAASLLPVLALAPRAGEGCLDLAAAPGGKSTHVAQLLDGTGVLVANDVNPERQKATVAHVHRLGLENVIVTAMDASKLPTVLPNWAHRVLLDAPCSATGTVGKDPAVRATKTPADFKKMSQLQKTLLKAAVDCCCPIGASRPEPAPAKEDTTPEEPAPRGVIKVGATGEDAGADGDAAKDEDADEEVYSEDEEAKRKGKKKTHSEPNKTDNQASRAAVEEAVALAERLDGAPAATPTAPYPGVVVYSTCSLAVEENEAVVDNILKTRDVALLPIGVPAGAPAFAAYRGRQFDPTIPRFCRRFLPSRHGLDGFFVAKFVKLSNAKFKKDV